jgi:hypothetical protein
MMKEDPDGHPAVDAWLTLGVGKRKPGNISALYAAKLANSKNKDQRKSAVYRLDGIGREGSSIVAKSCNPKTANLERIIYERILPQLPVSSLRYYGHVEMGECHWLFLEYARGVEWKIDDRTHVELAIQWLAEMHGSSAELDALSLLPYRGPRYYLSQLTTARQRIQESVSNPALTPADIEMLDDFLSCSGLLESHWKDIETFCATMPETLVHNDFVNKNVHVRTTKAGPVLRAFDWEMSGRGVPATDLSWIFRYAPNTTITRYWERLREFDTDVDLQDIEYLVILGAIFRVLDAVEWASQGLLTECPHKKIHSTTYYTDRLKRAYHALGWS